MQGTHGYELERVVLIIEYLMDPTDWLLDVDLPSQDVAGAADAALDALLSGPRAPTAILCFNDVAALGVLTGLRRLGAHVPNDVSVVGYDDIQFAAGLSPALTTVRQPKYQLGHAAAELLLDESRPGHQHQEIMLRPTLVVRGSTGPIGTGRLNPDRSCGRSGTAGARRHPRRSDRKGIDAGERRSVTPGNGVVVQWRKTQGGVTSQLKTTDTVPIYLEVIRSGNTFSAYTSPDGATWTHVAGSNVTFTMPAAVLVGLASTSHNVSQARNGQLRHDLDRRVTSWARSLSVCRLEPTRSPK